MTSLIIALTSAPEIISTAIDNYSKNVETYSVTLRSRSDGSQEEIKYYYKKPGFVKMEFIRPYKGTVLVYDPLKKEVRLRPFGFFKSLVLTLSPDNSLVKSSKGHTVDESDIGALLKIIKKLQSNGKAEILGDETIGNKPVVFIKVEGKGDFTADGIHRYDLRLDKTTYLPLKVSAYDIDGELIEDVLMDDLQINPELSDVFFSL